MLCCVTLCGSLGSMQTMARRVCEISRLEVRLDKKKGERKNMPGLWRFKLNIEKFLVLRRDGTVPAWHWFVLGGADPAAAYGLRAYAERARDLNYDPDYIEDVLRLATAMDDECQAYEVAGAPGDPTAPPHRKDVNWVVRLLKRAGKE